MRKDHLHASVDRRLLEALELVWRIEQEKALKEGRAVSKSSVTEEMIRLGIKAYCKMHNITGLELEV